MPKIIGKYIAVLIRSVVFSNAFPKNTIPQFMAKHVQYPSSFLVGVGAQHLHRVFYAKVYNGSRIFSVIVKDLLFIDGQFLFSPLITIHTFQIQDTEIGGKAFTEPNMVPTFLCGRI